MSPLDAGQGMRKTACDYDGYDVVGSGGGKIGKVGCLFKDEDSQREYVEVKGRLVDRFLGSGYYILPMELCTVDEGQGTVRASVDEDTVKNPRTWTAPWICLEVTHRRFATTTDCEEKRPLVLVMRSSFSSAREA